MKVYLYCIKNSSKNSNAEGSARKTGFPKLLISMNGPYTQTHTYTLAHTHPYNNSVVKSIRSISQLQTLFFAILDQFSSRNPVVPSEI